MDKIVIGIPRSLYYYYFKDLWLSFFQGLNIKVVVSPKTTKDIVMLGSKYGSDEMCTAMKNYLGHVAYLKDKCDYILIPRIDNYGIENQTCTNYLSCYDIVNNLITNKIIDYNIDINHGKTEEKAFIQIGKILGYDTEFTKRVYYEALTAANNKKDAIVKANMVALKSEHTKLLIVAHPYIIHDSYFGDEIKNYLKKQNVDVIYSDRFNSSLTSRMSKMYSKELYFKYSKENIGALALTRKLIDGVIFLTAFPCGPDSITNELVIRKIDIPYLQLIQDDLDGVAGMETRLESFLDIIERKKVHE